MLRTQVDSPTYEAKYYDPRGPQDLYFPVPAAPYLKLSAVHDDKTGMLTLFALNRSLSEEMPLRVAAKGFGALKVDKALQLHHADLKAINTKETPDKVAPTSLPGVRIDGEHVLATLKPASWNIIRVKAV